MLKATNILLAFSFLVQVLSGFLMVYFDTLKIHESFFLVHKFNAFILIILVFIHLILNWKWISHVLLKIK